MIWGMGITGENPESTFSWIFYSVSERNTQISAGVDSDTPDPCQPLSYIVEPSVNDHLPAVKTQQLLIILWALLPSCCCGCA